MRKLIIIAVMLASVGTEAQSTKRMSERQQSMLLVQKMMAAHDKAGKMIFGANTPKARMFNRCTVDSFYLTHAICPELDKEADSMMNVQNANEAFHKKFDDLLDAIIQFDKGSK